MSEALRAFVDELTTMISEGTPVERIVRRVRAAVPTQSLPRLREHLAITLAAVVTDTADTESFRQTHPELEGLLGLLLTSGTKNLDQFALDQAQYARQLARVLLELYGSDPSRR